MFNDKLRKKEIETFNLTWERYKKDIADFSENMKSLYTERQQALTLVKVMEERINEIANTPKEFNVTFQKI